MLASLAHIDRSLFLFLNGLHGEFFDPIMFWASKTLIWFPLFVFLFYLVIRSFRWKTIIIVLSVAILVTVSDQLCNLSKNGFKRLRPSHESSLSSEIHTVNDYKGGTYGFYSAHASNTFAIAVFLLVLFRKKYRFLPFLMICWALFFSYTRIYLGVHYPGDILAGILIGSLLGYLCGKFISYKLIK